MRKRKTKGWTGHGRLRSTCCVTLERFELFMELTSEEYSPTGELNVTGHAGWYWAVWLKERLSAEENWRRSRASRIEETHRGFCEPQLDINTRRNKAKDDARQAAEDVGRALAKKYKLEIEW